MDMQRYIEFFLNSSGALYEFICLEITHPQFQVPFRYTPSDTSGLSVKHEDGQSHDYAYQQLGVSLNTVRNDLDQKLDATIVDYDDALMDGIEQIDNGQSPKVSLRKYRSDDLDAPIHTIKNLEAKAISKDSEGRVTFAAAAPSLNSVATGELYTLERFPLLRDTL